MGLTIRILTISCAIVGFHCATRMVKTNYTRQINKDYLVLNPLPGNSTHYGPIMVEVLNDIKTCLYNIKIESGGRTMMDITMNVCKVFKLRTGFVKRVTQEFIKLVDEKLISCPIKKGNYTYLMAREIDFINSMNLANSVPSFIPGRGKYVLQMKGRTIVNKKSVSLFNATEWFEFVPEE